MGGSRFDAYRPVFGFEIKTTLGIDISLIADWQIECPMSSVRKEIVGGHLIHILL
jgi:hypothetical protein